MKIIRAILFVLVASCFSCATSAHFGHCKLGAGDGGVGKITVPFGLAAAAADLFFYSLSIILCSCFRTQIILERYFSLRAWLVQELFSESTISLSELSL